MNNRAPENRRPNRKVQLIGSAERKATPPQSPNRPGVEYRKVNQTQSQSAAPIRQTQKQPSRYSGKPAVERRAVSQAELSRRRALKEQRQRAAKAQRSKRIRRAVERAAAVLVFSAIGTAICLTVLFLYIRHDFSKSQSAKFYPVSIQCS